MRATTPPAPPCTERGADVPPASFLRMTKDAHGSSDAAVDPSSAGLPINRCQAGLPQDDMFGERPACYSERRRSRQTGMSAPPLRRISQQDSFGGLIITCASSAHSRAESHSLSFLSFHSELTYIQLPSFFGCARDIPGACRINGIRHPLHDEGGDQWRLSCLNVSGPAT